MSPRAQLLLMVPLAYVLGSVPFGLLVGRMRGVDVRLSGSGNIGATNVARVLGGKRWFFLVFVLDLLKSLGPMLLAGAAVRRLPAGEVGATTYLLWLAVGFAAVLGHMFSLFLRFKGGKGVATSTGVMFGLWPYFTLPGFVSLAAFFVAFLATRYISLGSMAGAVALPVAYVGMGVAFGWPVFGSQWPLLVFAVVMAGLILWKHRTNIARLRAGTENRFERRRSSAKPASGNGHGGDAGSAGHQAEERS